MPKQLEASLQRDMELIRGKIIRMSELAQRALKTSLNALTENNRQLAYAVILRDQAIDELEKEIDRLCLEFLVRQQPVAGILRFIYAVIKINAELERIGDYAESIARQVLKLSGMQINFSTAPFAEIAGLSIPMLHDATQAFLDQNADLARRTMEVEERVDGLRDQINANLMLARQEGRIPLEALTPLLTIARRYERVSDQGKNICEEVLYMCTGEYSKHKGTEVLRVLFVDEHNSCRTQMAEGIANSFGQPRLLFSSAGLQPRPIDPKTREFLTEKGIDISRQYPKSVDQVPHLEHYQVIIALAGEACAAFPPPPTKTVSLEWNVQDPSKVQGTPEEVQAAYEKTYQYIHTNIQDLVEAILGDETG
jgi:phosphate transport system protein